jgi:hypothetical protein
VARRTKESFKLYSVKLFNHSLQERSATLATLPEAVDFAAQRFPKFDSYETVRRGIATAEGYAKCLIDNEGLSTIVVIVPDVSDTNFVSNS